MRTRFRPASDQAEAARTEIKRRMLASADGRDVLEEGAVPPSLRGAGLALIAMIIPVGSIAIYLMLDSPWLTEVRDRIRTTAAAAAIDVASVKPTPGLPKLPTQPAARAPSDEDVKNAADGWRRLAQAYRVQGEIDKAAQAMERAIAAEK